MTVKISNEKIILTHNESEVTVYIKGATLTSWIYKSREQIFVSKKALYEGPKAIRGGIPLVFPQFGPKGVNGAQALPQHGFARVSNWKWNGISKETPKEITISFQLTKEAVSEEQRKIFSHDFLLTYNVTLADGSLTTEFVVKNISSFPFEFTTLLHTYLRVKDVRKIEIKGLTNCDFVDSLDADKRSKETREGVSISDEVDRVYENVNDQLQIVNTLIGNDMEIQKNNYKDVVLWNPWIDKAKKLADFVDTEYLEMICVEVGNVANHISLDPQGEWRGSQTLRVLV